MNKDLWLAKLLHRRGPLEKRTILEAWRSENGEERAMANSTFYDTIRKLYERYGIEVCNENRRFFLRMQPDGSHPVLELFSREGEGNILAAKVCGSQWVVIINEALTMMHVLRVHYAPFDKSSYEMDFHPYSLLVFENRLYVVGFSERHGEVRTFAADRMTAVQVLQQRFRRDASFSMKRHFGNSFGVYGGAGIQSAEVVLRVTLREAKYLRSASLHHSQREIEAAPDGKPRFALTVALTRDFIAEILKRGDAVEVEQPETLRIILKERAECIVKKYANSPAEDC